MRGKYAWTPNLAPKDISVLKKRKDWLWARLRAAESRAEEQEALKNYQNADAPAPAPKPSKPKPKITGLAPVGDAAVTPAPSDEDRV